MGKVVSHGQVVAIEPTDHGQDYSSASHGVTNEHHAVTEATLIEQLEGMTNLVGKHALSPGNQDRRDEQMYLVDQVHPPRSGRQAGAGDSQVMIDARLDRSDRLRSKLRSTRVRSVETSCSVLEKTTLSARCQIRANSALLGDCAATLGSVSHPIIIW